ncbi:CaiB/BaiF CoA-transferase family protein [Bradyrhizobium sp. AUGA SZCCT0042]|uniref:CaiB/BaiF CoA transferase family protein n=1 Tax=Bradyrhizobium sp. AUGA SZCCT0042 TaxID=2807651 RepID=UPI001BAC60E4|nr:CaiB/BaiF CoA-transferase family protein [Bradyrhizobium sp. AUGA SZCCT0042]MBR1295824.1 CoA transferase [Bradyrhizobium sp. AUGA SZCCT0042]
MTGPLNGFRVVEMGGIGPAPFAGALLGDLGADVLRIDRIARPGVEPDLPPRFDFYNRNKRSVALDLKQPQAVATVLDLLAGADALIEGFRPSVMERLGLGPNICHGINPRLVYARMTGWGQEGPMAQEAGHDINYLALTGALHCLGDADRPPPPPLNLVADLGGGAMYLVVGLLAASMEARQSGRGQTIDVAMIDGVTHLMSAFQAFRQQGSWTGRRADNIVDGGAPFYGSYATRDDKLIAVGAIEPQFYASLLKVMGIDGERLPDQNDRAAWPEMRKRFAEIFATRTRDEWVAKAAGRDACLAPVLTIDEAPQHPQMQSRDVYTAFDGLRHPSPAPRFSRTPSDLRRPTPAAGRDSREALADWGISAAQISELEAAGAMGQV